MKYIETVSLEDAFCGTVQVSSIAVYVLKREGEFLWILLYCMCLLYIMYIMDNYVE